MKILVVGGGFDLSGLDFRNVRRRRIAVLPGEGDLCTDGARVWFSNEPNVMQNSPLEHTSPVQNACSMRAGSSCARCRADGGQSSKTVAPTVGNIFRDLTLGMFLRRGAKSTKEQYSHHVPVQPKPPTVAAVGAESA